MVGHCFFLQLLVVNWRLSFVITLAFVCSFVMGEYRTKNMATILLEGDGGYSCLKLVVIFCYYNWS